MKNSKKRVAYKLIFDILKAEKEKTK